MSDAPLFVDTPLPSPITGLVVQITSNLDGDNHYVSGTGVIVGPSLAFAARHVLDDHWSRHHGYPMPKEAAAGSFSLILMQQVENLNAWVTTRFWVSEISDIVLLHLSPYSEGASRYIFPRLILDLLPPQVGEQIHAFGYSESVIEARPKELTVRHRPITTHGAVMEVHRQGRDLIAMPFPCFRTNARFDGGMSGGPVFNAAGRLCGLICSSLPASSEDEDHASYVVLLWPAMILMLDLNRDGHPPGETYPLFELVKQNIIGAVNSHLVTVDRVPELNAWRATFQPSAAPPTEPTGTEKGQSATQHESWWEKLWRFFRKIGGAARI